MVGGPGMAVTVVLVSERWTRGAADFVPRADGRSGSAVVLVYPPWGAVGGTKIP